MPVRLTHLPTSGLDHRGTIVLIHGGGMTSDCYLATPDGRPGWAPRFQAHGWKVALVDWSDLDDDEIERIDGESLVDGIVERLASIERFTLLVHSMSGPYGYRIIERLREQIDAFVAVAPGPPGNIQDPADVLSEDEVEVVVLGPAGQWHIPKSGGFLPNSMFVERKLIGDSRRFPRQAVDRLAGSLRPTAWRLLHQRQNIHAAQLRIEDPASFQGLPVLVITGELDTDHPREIDAAVADWLEEMGAAVTFDYLDQSPLDGNGHLLMSEDNSDEILDEIDRWIEEAVGQQRR